MSAVEGVLANYATKDNLNKAIEDVQGDTDRTIAEAYALASGAKGAAEAAQNTADSKTTMAAVEAKGYALDTNAQKYATDAEAAAKEYADTLIAANDAMTFKGIVNLNLKDSEVSASALKALPASANVGDTYKVAAAGTYGGTSAKIGDLFINAAASDDADPVWEHIASGYEAQYAQKLTVSNNKIQLDNGAGTNISSIAVATGAASGNMSISAAITGSGSDATITITPSFVWGTF
jgi:hypothetical protein